MVSCEFQLVLAKSQTFEKVLMDDAGVWAKLGLTKLLITAGHHWSPLICVRRATDCLH